VTGAALGLPKLLTVLLITLAGVIGVAFILFPGQVLDNPSKHTLLPHFVFFPVSQ